MRLWDQTRVPQLDLLGSPLQVQADTVQSRPVPAEDEPTATVDREAESQRRGLPLLVPLTAVFEDPANPRTEFPESEIAELAVDIRQRGILQPIVVHPADGAGRFRIHFGAKRFRAAMPGGLSEVPVTVRQSAADPHAQVAENQKRHALSPLDMARFIQSRVDLGESNAVTSGRLGMDLTTVAHHLALLDLPEPVDAALKSGRRVAPRTLYELSKMHAARPAAVADLLQGDKPNHYSRPTPFLRRAAAPNACSPTTRTDPRGGFCAVGGLLPLVPDDPSGVWAGDVAGGGLIVPNTSMRALSAPRSHRRPAARYR